MTTEPAPLSELEASIGYEFQDQSLLLRALTHGSYRNEHRDIAYDNERLEFLGDAVLGMFISTRLLTRFPQEPEGTLSRYKAGIVSEHGLNLVAEQLDLGRYLLIGRGELMAGGRQKSSLLSNALEALIAAVFLDSGHETVASLIDRLFGERLATIDSQDNRIDYKTRLQELAQSMACHDTPVYSIVSISGPEHRKSFKAAVHIAGKMTGQGVGSSKKEAEQAAAKSALGSIEPSK